MYSSKVELMGASESLDVVARRCDSLEACLGAVRDQRSARCEALQRVVISQQSPRAAYLESSLLSPRSPRIDISVQERVDTARRLEVQVTDRQLEVPRVQEVSRVVEVPRVHVVEKVVEVPQVQVQEVVRHVPRIHVQEIVRRIPKVEVQVVEKRVDVPQVQYVEKVVEVPQRHVREAALVDNTPIRMSIVQTSRDLGTFSYTPRFTSDFAAAHSPRRELDINERKRFESPRAKMELPLTGILIPPSPEPSLPEDEEESYRIGSY